MKTIKIAAVKNENLWASLATGNLQKPALNMVSAMDKKTGVAHLCATGGQTCRDSFLQRLTRHLAGAYPEPKQSTFRMAKVATNFTRLCMAFDSNASPKIADERVEEACRILNIIEEHIGFIKTKVYRIDAGLTNASRHPYMFRGSKNWMRSSHIFSLYILIGRLSLTHVFNKCNSFDDIVDRCRKSKSSEYNMTFMRQLIVRWPLMLLHFNELYKGLPFSRNHSSAAMLEKPTKNTKDLIEMNKRNNRTELQTLVSLMSNFSGEGVSRLCGGSMSTRDLVLKERLDGILKASKAKKA